MVIFSDLDWEDEGEYCGRILNGEFSAGLQQKVADFIFHFQAFDDLNCPSYPYLAAWRPGDSGIWYEYAGKKFSDLLGCHPSKLAQTLRCKIIGHYEYHASRMSPLAHEDSKKSLNRTQLAIHRHHLRERGARDGQVSAVYKVVGTGNTTIWLKDQARIEFFEEDGICLSLGLMVDVTEEMRAEEKLQQVQDELKQHRDHLEDMVRDRTEKLWKSQLEMVTRLARAAEFRDNRTGSHLAKMSRYCAMLGKAAGLRKKTSILLSVASSMHDIGKIGISDQILLKPARLSDSEFEQMKGHCAIGARLLAGHNSNLLKVAKTIALSHHEKWNGSGYPHGLSGSDIPLAGRITAICDVFDALTSERPYKKAWSMDQAISEIRANRGVHFDPALVDLFVENLPTIRMIHAHTPTPFIDKKKLPEQHNA